MIRKSATYAVAIFATRALSFVLLPLYTRYLTPADYGVLELLDLTLNQPNDPATNSASFG